MPATSPLTPDPIGQALLARLAVLRARAPAVARSAAGGPVHDMRVASRRVREALRLLDPGRKLERAARRITRALGGLREAQVTAGLFEQRGRSSRGPTALGYGQLLGEWRRRIREEKRRTREALAEVDLDDLAARLARFLSGAQRDPRRPWRRLLSRAERADAARAKLAGRPAPARLHALRIEVKRLRYAVEVLAGETPRGRRLVARLKRLQDALGEHHDLHVALAGARAARIAGSERAIADLRRCEARALARVGRALRGWPAGSFTAGIDAVG